MSLHNIGIEKAVIGALLTVDNAFDILEEDLAVSDFYADRHKEIYKVIQNLKERKLPVDLIMVSEQIKSNDLELLTGGDDYLTDITLNSPATAFNLTHYVDRIKDLAQRRAINDSLLQSQKLLNDTENNPNDVWSQLAEGVNAALQGSAGESYCELGELTEQFVEHLQAIAIDGVRPGVSTGLIELDNKLTVDKGNLCIIAARPSMGKTTLLQNIMRYISTYESGTPVFFSMEMPKIDIYKRMASDVANIHMKKIFTDAGLTTQEWEQIMDALKNLKDSQTIIDDRNALTVGQMRATLNRVRQKKGAISAIFVDYIQLMKCNDRNVNNRAEELGSISAGLKGLAKEFDCPVFTLAQLNRTLENRPDKRPIMSDLKGSGDIEQDADQIVFIYRDEIYNENSEQKGVAELIIAKQRNGAVGTVRVGFEGQYSRFVNLTPDFATKNEEQPFMEGNR